MWFYKIATALSHGLVPLGLALFNSGASPADIAIIREYMQAHNIVARAEIRKQREK